jgi:CRISPR system Cascade subunit CasD
MASYGSFTVQGDRPTELLPTKSSVLGLLHACLGVDRREVHQGHEFVKGINVLVGGLHARPVEGRNEAPLGGFLNDYHTTYTGTWPGMLGEIHARKGIDSKKQTITNRHYRTDVSFRVVVWGEEGKLQRLQEAVKQPHFFPYLGRKSCSLSAPMNPRLTEAASAAEAFGEDAPTFQGDVHPAPGVPMIGSSDCNDNVVATASSGRRVFKPRKITQYGAT